MTPEGAPTEVREVTTFGEALRHRWLLILLIAVLAPMIAVAAGSRVAATYQAQAQVYVDPQADPTALQQSDGLLSRDFVDEVTSDAVLARASTYLNGRESATWLAAHVSAAAVTGTNVVAVTAKAATAGAASEVANAMARAAIDQYAADAQGRLQATVQYLTTELGRISSAIVAAGSRSGVDAALQSEYDTTYTNLQNARLAQSHAADTLSLLQPAQPPQRPTSPDPLRTALIALVAATSVAVLLALVLERTGNRIHRADALAAACGTELIVPMGGDSSRSYRIGFMQLRARFPELHVVMVVAVSAGTEADEAATELGAAAAASGRNVLVVQTGRHSAKHLAGTPRLTVWQVEGDDDLRAVLARGWGHDLLVVAVPSPMRGAQAVSIAGHVDATVLVAVARRSRRDHAQEAATQLRMTGLPVTSGMLLPRRRRPGRYGGGTIGTPTVPTNGATAAAAQTAAVPGGDHR